MACEDIEKIFIKILSSGMFNDDDIDKEILRISSPILLILS